MSLPEFGLKGHDSITGFVGIVTGHCIYIDGTTQVQLTPRVASDGSKRSAEWFDQARIVTGDSEDKAGVGFR